MKIICSLSGLTYSVDYFPVAIPVGHTYHPIFDISPDRLHVYYTAYCNGQLKQEEIYLLTLALLKSSELMVFRCPAEFSPISLQKAIASIARVYKIVSLIQSIMVPSFSFPQISITPETANLANLGHWLKLWEDTYYDFLSGLEEDRYRDALKRKARALEKFIKSPNIPANKYSHVLADWAASAFQFPEYISDYWKEIINRCYNYDQINKIPAVDLDELIEHCEQNLDEYSIGTIYSNHLFSTLEEGKAKILSDKVFSTDKAGFTLLNPEKKEHANIISILENSTAHEPKREEYKSDFEFQRAKMRYKLSNLIKIKPADQNDGV